MALEESRPSALSRFSRHFHSRDARSCLVRFQTVSTWFLSAEESICVMLLRFCPDAAASAAATSEDTAVSPVTGACADVRAINSGPTRVGADWQNPSIPSGALCVLTKSNTTYTADGTTYEVNTGPYPVTLSRIRFRLPVAVDGRVRNFPT